MAKNRRSKRSRGQNQNALHSNSVPMPVMTLTPAMAFERNLGYSTDSCSVRGKTFLQSSVTNTSIINLSNLFPQNLGARLAAFSGIFARYRFKALMVKVMYNATSAGSIQPLAVGIQDDYSGEASPPTNFAGVVALRSSCTVIGGLSTAGAISPEQYIFWKPLDPKRWYYTQQGTGATNVDGRLEVPANIYAVTNVAAGTVFIEIDYSIVFAGADV